MPPARLISGLPARSTHTAHQPFALAAPSATTLSGSAAHYRSVCQPEYDGAAPASSGHDAGEAKFVLPRSQAQIARGMTVAAPVMSLGPGAAARTGALRCPILLASPGHRQGSPRLTTGTSDKRSASKTCHSRPGKASVNDRSQVVDDARRRDVCPGQRTSTALGARNPAAGASNGQERSGAKPNRCAITSAVTVAVLYCCTRCPAVRIMVLTCGATETRTPDL